MAPKSCTMMEAEMYGMMPSAKIPMRAKAPPVNIDKTPPIPEAA